MKQIQLSQGKFALVDDDMFDYLSQWKWHAQRKISGDYYAVRGVWGKKTNGKSSVSKILMHRVIMNVYERTQYIDHKNHITLDNRKENLRIVTPSENNKNRRSAKNSTSRFLGVSFRNDKKRWVAQIKIDGKVKYLGYFDTEIQAALKYNEAAIIHHGQFANLNVIPESNLLTAQNAAI